MSRIRDLRRIWQMSYVDYKGQSDSEGIRRGNIEKQLRKFKTGEREIKSLHKWSDEWDAAKAEKKEGARR